MTPGDTTLFGSAHAGHPCPLSDLLDTFVRQRYPHLEHTHDACFEDRYVMACGSIPRARFASQSHSTIKSGILEARSLNPAWALLSEHTGHRSPLAIASTVAFHEWPRSHTHHASRRDFAPTACTSMVFFFRSHLADRSGLTVARSLNPATIFLPEHTGHRLLAHMSAIDRRQ